MIAAPAPLLAGGLAVTLALGACGFTPRGSLVALDDPGRLFLDTDRGLTIDAPLRAALTERAFSLAPNRDEADIVLRVADEQRTQRIVSVRSTGRVSEFELGHAVSVAIARSADLPGAVAAPVATGSAAGTVSDDGIGGPVAAVDGTAPAAVSRPTDRVQVTREYTYDESQVLGKENEARILRGEMSEELVRQIVLRTVASLARDTAERGPTERGPTDRIAPE